MKIYLPASSLDECRTNIKAFLQSKSGFKEIGGYLLGKYKGDCTITEFLLDTNAESTGTRIKLSFDCFQRVEQILDEKPEISYIGTWHVHPGAMKPHFSSTDESTLFLEKLIIETDNPKEFKCPRIHLIFNETLEQISAYTMHVEIEVHLEDYWELEKSIEASDINQIDPLIKKLQELKKNLQTYAKKPSAVVIDDCFGSLGEIREGIDSLIDLVEEISEFMEIKKIVKNEKNNIEKNLRDLIKNGETLGIITLKDETKIELNAYRPSLIQNHIEDGTLLGFWRHYPIDKPPIEFQNIFIANFFRKVGTNLNTPFIYLLSEPTSISFFELNLIDFAGISFEEVEIVQEEMP
ncbi:MAG TPA: hypothetical protein VMV49_09740 [Candidatus Deferrimicrobium sp.]|nr:hypothetical protein [Candidatus Deferrimicrobium sp.]